MKRNIFNNQAKSIKRNLLSGERKGSILLKNLTNPWLNRHPS